MHCHMNVKYLKSVQEKHDLSCSEFTRLVYAQQHYVQVSYT